MINDTLRRCAMCGRKTKHFEKFCSEKCAGVHAYKVATNAAHTKCRHCKRWSYNLSRDFCDDTCRRSFAQTIRERRIAKGLPPDCVWCGNQFMHSHENKFCSAECSSEALNIVVNEPEPIATTNYPPTSHAPGSWAKVEVLRDRYSKSLPLWHPDDRYDFEGITGFVQVRREEL